MSVAASALGLSLLLGAAAVLPSGEEGLGWTCQRDFRQAGGILRVNKELTAEGRHLAYTVGFRASSESGEETDLFWSMQRSGDWFRRLEYAYLRFVLRAPREGPVAARIYEDGALAAEQPIMDRQWVERIRLERLVIGTVSFGPESAVRPKLHGTSALVAVAVEPDGRRLARARFPLPDWRSADRIVEAAVADLDRDSLDYRKRCGQYGGEQELIEVSPGRSAKGP